MEICFSIQFIFGRSIFWVLRFEIWFIWQQCTGNQGLALCSEERGDILSWADGWGWKTQESKGGAAGLPPPGAFLGARVQLMCSGGSAQLNLSLTDWRSHYSDAGCIYTAYAYSEAVSAYVFRDAHVYIYILRLAEAAFKELGGGVRCCFPKCVACLNKPLQLRHRVSYFNGHHGFGAQLIWG